MNTVGQQIPLAVGLSDHASFDNFWQQENAELISSLQQITQQGQPSPLYYYGENEAGKSHLLYALMRQAKTNNKATTYLALNQPAVNSAMLEAINASDIVCIDDIHLWAGDADKERALFALFERIKHSAGVLVAAANQRPDKAGFKLPDLISRLSSGVIYPLTALNDEQRHQALKMRAEQRGLKMNDEAIRYLLNRMPRSNREVFSFLDKIDTASLIEKRKITIPFLQKMLA